MPLWKRDAKSKLKELVREEEYSEINSLVDNDINILSLLTNLLEDKDSKVRGKAVAALAEAVLMHEEYYFRELEDTVVLRVLKLLKDSNPEVRQEAALFVSSFPSRAYCGIATEGPEFIEQVAPQLVRLLEDDDPRVQRSAGLSLIVVAYWLLDNKKQAKEALNILSRLAEHKDLRNRNSSAWFWKKHAKRFPEAAKEAIPSLVKLTKDPDEKVRECAEGVLKSLVTNLQ